MWGNMWFRRQPQILSAPGPYGFLPSGEEEVERPTEEEFTSEGETVEGEFRVLPEDEPAAPATPTGSARYEDRETAKRAREAAQFGEKLERTRAEAALAKPQLEMAKLEKEKTALRKTKYELGKAKREEGFKMAGRVAKAFAPAGAPGGVAKFYMGSPKRSLYVPETPRPLPSSGTGVSAAEALRPDLGRLKEATRLGAAPTPGIDAGYARRLVAGPGRDTSLQYSFLRELAMPKGLSRLEQAAFAEIQANGDADTMEHVKSELARLGYPRRDVEVAVRGLEEKGFVEKRKELPGEPAIYALARGVQG